MRNHFEHVDSRIDLWWSSSDNHSKADWLVGPRHMIDGFTEGQIFRHYDPETGLMHFWGDRYPLRDILAEVDALLDACIAALGPGHWMPQR